MNYNGFQCHTVCKYFLVFWQMFNLFVMMTQILMVLVMLRYHTINKDLSMVNRGRKFSYCRSLIQFKYVCVMYMACLFTNTYLIDLEESSQIVSRPPHLSGEIKVKQGRPYLCMSSIILCFTFQGKQRRHCVLPLIMNLIKILIFGSHHRPIKSESLEVGLEICTLTNSNDF